MIKKINYWFNKICMIITIIEIALIISIAIFGAPI